ncbi:peptidoglycan-binding protein [Clostridium sp. SHJSY1]|uniref:peptidoglycan-binding domain-containing protein n=1 Tax=Clostridium sp. SHJSY1 TaxID=2942483 RepID=UPI0028748483|nr:peptidoglycan-binding domain-containing protein [Clostridium sp. SHJSY1]MDS0526381.1 peptidoglycan-binding protein [Clostridium sp. SHJSY1]
MKKMNKTKIKTLCAGVLATVLLSSTSVFAATDISSTTKTNASSTTKYMYDPSSMYRQYYDGTVYVTNVHLENPITYNGKSYTYINITMSDNSHINTFAESLVDYNHKNNDISIASLQILLNHYGYCLHVTGIFDTNTFDALSDFQRKYPDCGAINGVCGEKTWKTLVNNF